MDFARDWSAKAWISPGQVLDWTGLDPRKFRDWRQHCGKANEHNGTLPRIISDDGPQFVAKDFKEYIRLGQTTHVQTNPHAPQSKGKLKRYHRTSKDLAPRPKTPLSLEDVRRVGGVRGSLRRGSVAQRAGGYVTPQDRMEGRHEAIHTERDRKREAAREARRGKRAGLEVTA